LVASLTPVYVLAETSEVDGLSADLGSLYVEVSGFDGVVRKC
jgi:hypothetical protein